VAGDPFLVVSETIFMQLNITRVLEEMRKRTEQGTNSASSSWQGASAAQDSSASAAAGAEVQGMSLRDLLQHVQQRTWCEVNRSWT
jgi:hypothetical protein